MNLGLPPPSESLTWAGAIATSAIAFALSIQKLFKIWADGRTDINKAEGENQVVNLLRQELERLSTQNQTLATRIETLQTILNTTTSDNHDLKGKVYLLSQEVSSLRSQLPIKRG